MQNIAHEIKMILHVSDATIQYRVSTGFEINGPA